MTDSELIVYLVNQIFNLQLKLIGKENIIMATKKKVSKKKTAKKKTSKK